MNYLRHFFLLSLLLAGLTACSGTWFGESEEPPLPGERFSVLEFQKEIEAEDIALDAQGFIVSDAWQNSFWPQAGGYPNHSLQHLSLNIKLADQRNPLTKKWSVSIGKGAQDDRPLTAQPIVAENFVFTMDTQSVVRAFSIENGKEIWKRDLKLKKDKDDLISGALGYGEGLVFATSGQNFVYALNPQTGAVVWVKELLSPTRAAPTVLDKRVYIPTLDSNLIVLNSEDGSILWEHQGLSESAGLLGSASPAVNAQIAVVGYPSGALYALRVENGSVAWEDNLASIQSAVSLSKISDIKALPVIDKGTVFAISYGGKMVSIDESTGRRLWQREIGSTETPWVAGNLIFVVTSQNKLVALSRDSGAYAWVTPLRQYKDEEDRFGSISWTAPILASNTLILINTLGEVVFVNPENGSILSNWDIGDEVTTSPIIADSVLYILTDKGRLTAYH